MMRYIIAIWSGLCVLVMTYFIFSRASSKRPPQTFTIPLGVYFRSNGIITHQLTLILKEGQPVRWQMDRNLPIGLSNYMTSEILEYGTNTVTTKN